MAELLTDRNAPDPVLPGASFIFEAIQQAAVPSNPGNTVVVAQTGNYGPVGKVMTFDSYAQALGLVNLDDDGNDLGAIGPADTPLRRAILNAFLGEGLPGRGGAGKVKAVRLAGAGVAAASRVLLNTGGANGITLTARQPGTLANGWSVTVRAGLLAGQNDLVILDGTREAEIFSHNVADMAGLVATINASSAYVTAVLNTPAVALAPVVAQAFAGGNDGAAFTSGDYSTMLGLLEFEEFGIFAASGITDPTIIAALVAWKNSVKTTGKRVRLVVGGPALESFGAHQARAAALNDPDILCFGTGSITSTVVTDDGSAVTVGTADGVGRVAGAWARRDELQDLVNVRFAGWTIVGGATRAQAKIAATSGMSLLSRDGHPDAPTKIGLGVTTYTSDTPSQPRRIYSNAKFVTTLHGLERDLTSDQEGSTDELIDGRSITTKSRDLVKGRAQTVVKRRIDSGALQAGSSVDFDPDRPPAPGDAVVALLYEAVLVPGLRGIRNRIVVGL